MGLSDPLLPPTQLPANHTHGTRAELPFPNIITRTSKLTDRRRLVFRLSALIGTVAILGALLLDPFLLPGTSSNVLLWPPNARQSANAATSNQASQPIPLIIPGKDDTIRFLSLNAFIRPLLIGADWKDDRLQRLAPVLASYTIACTQEIFWSSGSRKRRLLRQLRERGIPYAAAAPLPGLLGVFRWPPKIIDGGLTITSRFPIVETDFHIYKHTVLQSIDAIVAKGVLYARVRVPIARHGLETSTDYTHLHVFTTHMQASNGLEDTAFKRTRAAQLVEFSQFVRRKASEGLRASELVIMAGDFNVDGRVGPNNASSSDPYRDMMAILSTARPFHDVIYESYNFTHPVTSAGGLDGSTQKNERLDYIFYHSPQQSPFTLLRGMPPLVNQFYVADELPKPPFRTLSDHYGVEATLGLR